MPETTTILILANNDVGLLKFRKELLIELTKRGYEIYVSLPVGERTHELTEMGLHVIQTPMDRRGMNPIKDALLFLAYLRKIMRLHPRVTLTYTIKPNVYGGMACRLMRRQYISTITGLGTSIENEGLLQRMALILYRLGVNGSRCVFFQNQSNMDFMLSRHIAGKKKKLLPGSGVDLQEHSYREYPDESFGVRFLSIMRVMRDKGIFELLECARMARERSLNVSFTLIGDFDDDGYREVVNRSSQEGIIQYLGFRNDVDEILAAHHCVINPSYHEGMSNVLLEAAACGRPVIASNIPGCKEAFEEGITGYGFEAKNADQLMECIERFLALSHEAKEKMGRLARQKMQREFDRRKIVSTYIQEIETCTRES